MGDYPSSGLPRSDHLVSALSGVAGSDGRLTITVAAPDFFFRAMGFTSAGALAGADSGPSGLCNGTCTMFPTGSVMFSSVNAIVSYMSGLPVDVFGGLCTEAAAPASFSQGVGITAAGRVAIN